MSKKNKKNKKNKSKELAVSAIFDFAAKEAEKAGERSYLFQAKEEEHVFKVKATKSKNPKGDACIRKGYMLDGKQITAQAARLLLFQVGIANGETPEGRKVAHTVPALAAVKAWQEKHSFLLEEPKGKKSKKEKKGKKGKKKEGKEDWTKKELKISLKKKEVKKVLSNTYSKKEIKKVLKPFGDSKVFPFGDLVNSMDNVAALTVDEIKAMFSSHF